MNDILIAGANSYIGLSFAQYLEKFSDQYNVSRKSFRDVVPKPEMFIGYDCVFCAVGIAHLGKNAVSDSKYYDINRDLVIDIAKNAKIAGVKQFIVMSSLSVYGLVSGQIALNSIPAPVDSYGKSKLQADDFLVKENSSNFKTAIIRAPMVYGKNCRGNYQRLRKLALSIPLFPACNNKRSMIYIGNLCYFLREIVDKKESGIFIPQNEEYVCTSDMVKLIAKAHSQKVYLVPFVGSLLKRIPIKTAEKVFGSLICEKENIVDRYSFEDSILLSEQP